MLQPIRVPAGWTITWNNLIEEDPSKDNFIVFNGSTIFAARHEASTFEIDLEFDPKNIENGQFVARFFRYDPSKSEDDQNRADDQIVRSRERSGIVAIIEGFMATLELPTGVEQGAAPNP